MRRDEAVMISPPRLCIALDASFVRYCCFDLFATLAVFLEVGPSFDPRDHFALSRRTDIGPARPEEICVLVPQDRIVEQIAVSYVRVEEIATPFDAGQHVQRNSPVCTRL